METSATLSINTDFLEDTGDATPRLRQIAAAGFTHVHWCHYWTHDYLYSDAEIDAVGQQLADLKLTLCDVHGSTGPRMAWYYHDEDRRRAGVELVKNRVHFARRLGGDCVVMHPVAFHPDPPYSVQLAALRKSLAELEPYCRDRGIRLALENGPDPLTYADYLVAVVESWPAEYLGFCFDSGHHLILLRKPGVDGPAENRNLDRLTPRLYAVHLHDNDGTKDQHDVPFLGRVDWREVVRYLKLAKFAKPLTLELAVDAPRTGRTAEEMLADAYRAAQSLHAWTFNATREL